MNRKRLIIVIIYCICGIVSFVSCSAFRKEANDKVIIAFIDSACSKETYEKLSGVLWKPDEIKKCGDKRNHSDYVLEAFESTLADLDINYEIMLLSVFDENGECSTECLIEAIKFAEKNGAMICNLSLSTYTDNRNLRAVMEQSDMLFVAAAGNEGENLDEGFPSFPTNWGLENVISVAASDEKQKLLETSNYGENTVDFAMNGVIEYKGEIVEGTSIAAGRMSAVVAGILSLSEKNIVTSNDKKEVLSFLNNNCFQKIYEML